MPILIRYGLSALLCLIASLPRVAGAQHGAARLHELVDGLTVTGRVLVMGMRPDDADPGLIAWLARGRHVETGYLSVTRGEAAFNFLGGSSGVVLGAVHVGESVAARRVDGGLSFFGRAYDFGYARSAEDVWTQWNRDTLLADIVTVIRSFRPHVIVSTVHGARGPNDGQREVLRLLAREAVEMADDTVRCPVTSCGLPWRSSSLYEYGEGLAIDLGEYDPILGSTFRDVAVVSRAQHRSGGLADLRGGARPDSIVRLQRVSTQLPAQAGRAAAASIFEDVDTTFARLSRISSPQIASSLASLVAVADSARLALDLAQPWLAVERLGRVVRFADAVRTAARACGHPDPDARQSVTVFAEGRRGPRPRCDAAAMDLDASIDIVRRRAYEALLGAAGIVIEATADRELVADADSVATIVTISNHGRAAVSVGDVGVSGTPGTLPVIMKPVLIPPGSTARFERWASGLGSARPWWIAARGKNFFPNVASAVDGVSRPATAPSLFNVPGVTVPEEYRRASDVRVTLMLGETLLTTSVGPIVHRAVSPSFGIQERPVAAVPALTLALEQALEWLPAGEPIDRKVRLTLRSYRDVPQTLSLHVALAPAGARVDSLPKQITLAPREQRDVFVRIHGVLAADRHELGVIARSTTEGGRRFYEGFRSIEHSHIAPIHIHRNSAMYLQAVDMKFPPRLAVLYVQGVGDGAEASLRQLGIANRIIEADELPRVDISTFSTVVLGPRAYEAHPALAMQSERLLDFAKSGGTVVVLNPHDAPRASSLTPFPAPHAVAPPHHVLRSDAPVTILPSRLRVLNWPNRIRAGDWGSWVGARALDVPADADERFARVIEMHDPGQPSNPNAILVARLGHGVFVATSLTFFEQIPAGIPGALRLFVNLLSAGCEPSPTPRSLC